MNMFGRLHGILSTVSDAAVIRLRNVRRTDARAHKRLTLVHFGNYEEGYWNLAKGGHETYYAQKFATEFLASLIGTHGIDSVTSVTLSLDKDLSILPNGVRTVGVELYPQNEYPKHLQLQKVIAASLPTHLIVMSPSPPLIAWALKYGIPTLPLFADSFRGTGIVTKIKHRMLAHLLNNPAIDYVANHNLAASLDLKRIGVNPSKIVPFDWPALVSPTSYAPKHAPSGKRPFRLLYVGAIVETKGIGDAIRSLAKLRDLGKCAELTIIGQGNFETFQTLAKTERVTELVHYLGKKSHSDVLATMRDHDAVIVPSHRAYPEGLPMTLYEALCTRTPLLTSDHPMFALKIKNEFNALIFAEQDASAIAKHIARLMDFPALYEMLSLNGGSAAEGYLCPLKYDTLISTFVNAEVRSQLGAYSLLRYEYGLPR